MAKPNKKKKPVKKRKPIWQIIKRAVVDIKNELDLKNDDALHN